MAAKDYMVDVSKVPDYGPPNMAAQLYQMMRGIPQAYQQGIENEYKNQASQFEQELQPYKKKVLQRADILGDITVRDAQDIESNRPRMPTDPHGVGDDRESASDARRVQNNTGGGGLFNPVPGARAPGQQGSINHLIDNSPTKVSDPDAVATKLAGMLGVDPNTALTPEQQKAVAQALSWEQPDATASVNPTLPGGMPSFDPRGAPPNIQPGEGGGPATAMAQAPMGPGGPQGPGAAPGAGGPPMPPQGRLAGGPLVTGQVPLSPDVPATNPAAGMRQFLPPTTPSGPDPNAPWTQQRVKKALSDADKMDDYAGRPGMTAFPGRAAAIKEQAKALREEAKEAQKAIDENRKLTGPQKEALPGKTVQETAAIADVRKKQLEARQKMVDERAEAYKPAQDSIQVLDEMKGALKAGGINITTGPLAQNALKIKQAVNSMASQAAGYPVDIFKGVPEAEQVDKLNAYLSAAVAKAMTARPTQYEFKAFQQQNPGLLTSPKGSEHLMDILRQTKVQEKELARMASKFDVTGKENWIDVEEKYYWEHPIISPLNHKPIDAQQAKDGTWYRLNPMTGKWAKE